jgi:hypothetical protein
LEEVKASLYSKELFDKELSTSHPDGPVEGLVVRGRSSTREPSSSSQPRSKSKSKNSHLICNYCKKKWHIKAECFKLQNKNKEKYQKVQKPAEASIVLDEIEDNDVYAVTEDAAKIRQG